MQHLTLLMLKVNKNGIFNGKSITAQNKFFMNDNQPTIVQSYEICNVNRCINEIIEWKCNYCSKVI